MKKVFKLCSAELSKMFLRPSILVFIFLLAASVFTASLIYKPQTTQTPINYIGTSVEEIYTAFISDSASVTENENILDSVKLENAKTAVDNRLVLGDKLELLKNKIEACYTSYIQNDESAYKKTNINLSNQEITTAEAETILVDFKNNTVYPLYNYIKNEIGTQLNFYMTKSDYNKLCDFFENFYRSLPSTYSEYSVADFQNKYNYITQNFSFTKSVYPIINNLVKIEIDEENITEIINTYYIGSKAKLATKFDEMEAYYLENAAASEDEAKKEILKLISEYLSIANMSSNILKSELLLAQSADYNDSYLQNCIGFENFRRYEINDNLQNNKYMLTNNLFDYNTLKNLNFNTNSGTETNAFDFTFFALQIASIVIIVFLLYTISNIIGDEQNKGTMKLLAMRPISRNKILAGKFIAAITLAFISLVLTAVGSFCVGISMFGLPTVMTSVVTFNATTSFAINTYLLLLIYLASVMFNIFFFVSLGMMISVISKSGIVSVFVGSIIYILTIALNSPLINSAWYKYLPTSNLDLFRYFGNTGSGLLSMAIPPDANFFISLIISSVSILFMCIISHAIFRKRDVA